MWLLTLFLEEDREKTWWLLFSNLWKLFMLREENYFFSSFLPDNWRTISYSTF